MDHDRPAGKEGLTMTVFNQESSADDRANSTIIIAIEGWEAGTTGPRRYRFVNCDEGTEFDFVMDHGKQIPAEAVPVYERRPETLLWDEEGTGDVLEVRVGQWPEKFLTPHAFGSAVRVTIPEGTTRADARRLLRAMLEQLDAALDKAEADWRWGLFLDDLPHLLQAPPDNEGAGWAGRDRLPWCLRTGLLRSSSGRGGGRLPAKLMVDSSSAVPGSTCRRPRASPRNVHQRSKPWAGEPAKQGQTPADPRQPAGTATVPAATPAHARNERSNDHGGRATRTTRRYRRCGNGGSGI
jgi:hypothetical protein